MALTCPHCRQTLPEEQVKHLGESGYYDWYREGYCSRFCYAKHGQADGGTRNTPAVASDFQSTRRRQPQVGMTTQQLIAEMGSCKKITTMGTALAQVAGFVASDQALTSMAGLQLWVYEVAEGKWKVFLTDGIVDEVRLEN